MSEPRTDDIRAYFSDIGNRLGHLETQQDTVLAELRGNAAALVRLEGTLDTRSAQSRGLHDLSAQRDDMQDKQIQILHTRISAIKRGMQSAIGMGMTALLAVGAMLTQWFSSR